MAAVVKEPRQELRQNNTNLQSSCLLELPPGGKLHGWVGGGGEGGGRGRE